MCIFAICFIGLFSTDTLIIGSVVGDAFCHCNAGFEVWISVLTWIHVCQVFVLSFLGRGPATVLFPIQGVLPNNTQQSWETVKIAGPGPHWPVVSHRWIEYYTVLCTYLCHPNLISCLNLLMCGFVCHGVEVTLWSRYLLENLVGFPFVGKLPASFGT